ncbi:MAG: MCE family protein, partial [Muribaculaceae bacterium]|nr:MCE family protein [Muribaculaceae bacterium]
MKKIFRKEFVIGACVIATLLILVFGIDYLKGINVFKAANYYYVSYTDVAGLAQSAPVTINGYKVGLVREINYEYDNPGHVIVELSLDKKLRLTQGTKAVLTTDMLGTATIKLEMAPGNDFHIIGDKLVGVNEVGLMDNVTGDILPGVVNMLPKIDSMLVSLQSIAA